ncbi:MAG TPA: deoxyuridine 5'-triphosphate nucleotidohydrolase [Thermomicrobiales bacterium]|nr:deoxyuridine 5'-triphosphate nucleotidohydrolase [Thermomicrobiales bacterium]
MDDGRPLAGVLSREEIRRRIAADRPLIAEWIDLAEQLQPNGFDLSLREVNSIDGRGVLAEAKDGRKLPALGRLDFDADGFIDLGPGPYQIVFNEIVDLPTSIMALGRPRSSLCRSGVTVHTAVWDAGYRGRSTALLNVLNPNGFRVQRNARLLQLVFATLTDATTESYAGRYQGENIERR